MLCAHSWAQTVEPVVAEYTGTGKGSFVVSNSSFSNVAVVLEPQSFTIDADGNGLYTALDPGVHVELSKTSLRLGPRETETIFYKVTADQLPAWLTIYATFAPLHPGPGVNVHVMLPHTVYLYSKVPLKREDLRISELSYDADSHRVICELTNVGHSAGRATKLEASAGRRHASVPGFPLLPGGTRRISIPWIDPMIPELLAVDFGSFVLRDHITVSAEQAR